MITTLYRQKLFFMFILLFASASNAKVIDLTDYKTQKHFGTGILTDYTPAEISSGEIQVDKQGPLVFVWH